MSPEAILTTLTSLHSYTVNGERIEGRHGELQVLPAMKCYGLATSSIEKDVVVYRFSVVKVSCRMRYFIVKGLIPMSYDFTTKECHFMLVKQPDQQNNWCTHNCHQFLICKRMIGPISIIKIINVCGMRKILSRNCRPIFLYWYIYICICCFWFKVVSF